MEIEDVETMVKDIISAADYDLSKELDPELAEEPEFAEDFLRELVEVAISHLNKLQ